MKESKAPTVAKKDLPAALLMLRCLPDQIGELQVEDLSIDFTLKTVLLQNDVRLLADLKELTVAKIAWFKPSGRGSLGKLKRWLIKFAFSRSSGVSTAATTSKAHLYSKSASRLSSPTGKSELDCESGSSLSPPTGQLDVDLEPYEESKLDFALKGLAGLPEDMTNIAIVKLPIGTRLKGGLIRNGIKRLSGLRGCTAYILASFEGLGVKSLSELYQFLIKWQDEWRQSFRFADQGEDKGRLIDTVRSALSDEGMTERLLSVLVSRWGLDGSDGKTLKETAGLMHLTRQRVQHHEKTAIQILKSHIGEQLHEHIARVRTNRTKPLYVELLAIEDPYFSGFEAGLPEAGIRDGLSFMAGLICSQSSVRVLPWDGKKILTQLSGKDIARIKNRLIAAVESFEGQSYDVFLLTVNTILEEESCSELGDIFLKMIDGQIPVSRLDNGHWVITRKGSSTELAIRAVLEDSAVPLHYSQIYNLGKKELSHLTEEHVQNVLHSDSTTYLYDRGKYGLLKHLMLTDDVVEEIARLFKLVIESGPSDREWHCRELLDYLPNEVLPQNADINQYTADIVMKVCNAGRTLKRMVWVSSSSQKYRRLETLDTCAEDILLQAGGPMTNEELMARLTELRGSRWQKYAQQVLAANNRMIRIDENLWGLTDRDLHIGKDAAQEFLNSLFHLLSSTRQLHITKVSSVLPEVEKLELNPTLIAQLAKADGRFRCTRSMHLVLNVSDSVQALSILAAIKLVLQESTSPMELPKLTARVSDMIGHEVNSKSLTPHLYKLAKLAVVVKTDTDKRRGWVLNRSKRN